MWRDDTADDNEDVVRTLKAQLAFMRPLSAITHYIDYQFWPGAAWLMHLHSLLWAAFLFFSLLVLYRELISPAWVCALTMFIYALTLMTYTLLVGEAYWAEESRTTEDVIGFAMWPRVSRE